MTLLIIDHFFSILQHPDIDKEFDDLSELGLIFYSLLGNTLLYFYRKDVTLHEHLLNELTKKGILRLLLQLLRRRHTGVLTKIIQSSKVNASGEHKVDYKTIQIAPQSDHRSDITDHLLEATIIQLIGDVLKTSVGQKEFQILKSSLYCWRKDAESGKATGRSILTGELRKH